MFSRDVYKIQQAWDKLDVGGVVVGDVPSYRVDNMPYGASKIPVWVGKVFDSQWKICPKLEILS